MPTFHTTTSHKPTYTPKMPRVRIGLAAVTLTLVTFALSIVTPADRAAPGSTVSVFATNVAPTLAKSRHAA